MKANRTNLLKVFCMVGYGVFIGITLIQSFDVYAESELLSEIGKCGLGFGVSTMFIYLLNRNGMVCRMKRKIRLGADDEG